MAESKDISFKCSESVYLQFGGKEASLESIRDAIKENYNETKKGKDTPKTLSIYLKPEDLKAYYVINDDFAGEITIPLV